MLHHSSFPGMVDALAAITLAEPCGALSSEPKLITLIAPARIHSSATPQGYMPNARIRSSSLEYRPLNDGSNETSWSAFAALPLLLLLVAAMVLAAW